MTEDTEKYVTSIQEVDSKRRRVFINYEPAFVLYISEIRRYGIRQDSYIEPEDYDDIMNILGKRARIRAMALLKDRDYTRNKLYEKLKQGGYPDACIDNAIQYVASYGYIDDRRYACNYVLSHMKSKSRKAIEQNLIQKGISTDIIYQVCDECYDEYSESSDYEPEVEIVLMQLRSRYYNKDLTDYAQLQKVKASLYRKGFKIDNINKAVDIALDKNELN